MTKRKTKRYLKLTAIFGSGCLVSTFLALVALAFLSILELRPAASKEQETAAPPGGGYTTTPYSDEPSGDNAGLLDFNWCANDVQSYWLCMIACVAAFAPFCVFIVIWCIIGSVKNKIRRKGKAKRRTAAARRSRVLDIAFRSVAPNQALQTRQTFNISDNDDVTLHAVLRLSENYNLVRQMCVRSWKDSLTGVGADAVGLSHSGLKINRVTSIHNESLFQRYETAFNHTSKRYYLPDHVYYQPIETERILRENYTDFKLSSINVSCPNSLADSFTDIKHLRRGETLLFHGTTKSNAIRIATKGFKLSKSQRGQYGHPAIYLAESSQKADQYADPRQERSSSAQTLCLLVVRVALGRTEMFEAKKEGKKYDTIVGGSRARFREFVVTDPTHLYPQFLIEYTRTNEREDVV